MNPFWWGALAFGPPAFVVGICFTLTLAAVIHKPPMDAHRYTGDLPDHLDQDGR